MHSLGEVLQRDATALDDMGEDLMVKSVHGR
jgi:hypothetical protein